MLTWQQLYILITWHSRSRADSERMQTSVRLRLHISCLYGLCSVSVWQPAWNNSEPCHHHGTERRTSRPAPNTACWLTVTNTNKYVIYQGSFNINLLLGSAETPPLSECGISPVSDLWQNLKQQRDSRPTDGMFPCMSRLHYFSSCSD